MMRLSTKIVKHKKNKKSYSDRKKLTTIDLGPDSKEKIESEAEIPGSKLDELHNKRLSPFTSRRF